MSLILLDIGVVLYFLKLAILLWMLINLQIQITLCFVFVFCLLKYLIFKKMLKLTRLEAIESLFFVDQQIDCTIGAVLIYEKLEVQIVKHRIKERILKNSEGTHFKMNILKVLGEYYWREIEGELDLESNFLTLSDAVNGRTELGQVLQNQLDLFGGTVLKKEILWQFLFIPNYFDEGNQYSVIIPMYSHILGDAISSLFFILPINDDFKGLKQRLIKIPLKIKILLFFLYPFYFLYFGINFLLQFKNQSHAFKEGTLASENTLILGKPFPLNPIKSLCKKLQITINEFLTGCVTIAARIYFD